MTIEKVQIFNGLDELTAETAQFIKKLADKAIKENGIFTIALSGGNTPKPLFKYFSNSENKDFTDWSKVHIFWGDDRCVSPDSDDSNFKYCDEEMFSKMDIPKENIHRILGELQSPEMTAAAYNDEINTFFTKTDKVRNGFPEFDLIMLGMGNDGHTASLFPDNPNGLEETQKSVIPVPPPTTALPAVPRVSITFPIINNAQNLLFMLSGSDKLELANSFLNKPFDPNAEFPAARVKNQSTNWFISI